MARQPKTAQPKTKFDKFYTCGKCGRKTNDFRLARHNGVVVNACKTYPDCKPTPLTV